MILQGWHDIAADRTDDERGPKMGQKTIGVIWTTGGRTSTDLGMIPGSVLVPCIVCVFPEDVTPYANTVTVCEWVNSVYDVPVSDTHNATVHYINKGPHIIIKDLSLSRVVTVTGCKAGEESFFEFTICKTSKRSTHGNLKI